MFHNHRNQNMAVSAKVTARPNVNVGGMARKTLYRVENFLPIPVQVAKEIIGDQLYGEIREYIEEIKLTKNDVPAIPIGRLIEGLGKRATAEIRARLFSDPVWIDESPNLVVMAGLTDSIDKHFKGSSYTAAWYVGLVSGTPTFAEGNTMAVHAGWFEVVPYAGARPAFDEGTVVSGSVDNSASKAAYSITGDMVVGGAFLVTLPTAGQTSGTLYGGAAFTGGNRTVANGDTLNVTVTASATAA